MEYNVNERVKIKLTDYGRQILRENNDDIVAPYLQAKVRVPECFCFKNYLPKEDEFGWSEWSLWEVFAIFGKHIPKCGGIGIKIPFETTIEIIEG